MKSQKGIIHIGLILVLLVLGVGALVFVMYKTNSLPVVTTTQPLSSPSSTNTPSTLVDDEVSGWAIYSNSQYDFSFKYPDYLVHKGGVGGTFLGNPQPLETFGDESTMREGTDAAFNGFSVYIVSNTEKSLDNFLAKEISTREESPRGIYLKKINKVAIAGQEAAYVDVEATVRQYFIPTTNNKIILFSVVRSSESFISTINQILSTFEFVDQADNNSNWNTYTNTSNKYSINYPKDWTALSIEPGPGEVPLNPNSRGLALFPNKYTSVTNARMYIQLETDGPQNLAAPSYEEWISTGRDVYYKVTNRSQVTFKNRPAAVVTGTFEGFFPTTISTTFFTSSDRNTYFSLSTVVETGTQDSQILDQIVSTFKFTD